MEDYHVQLDVYDGPMDLLLYLVRKDEVDIHDIPIARITEQYCQYVEMLRTLDIDLAGEFLLMAAWLIEIKTRMLLPTDAPPAEQGAQPGQAMPETADPRAELVRQLLAYKQFKDLAGELGDAAAAQALKYPRVGLDFKQLLGDEEPKPLDIADVQIWDLFEAFGKLMEATGRTAAHSVTYDDTPIHEHAADIVDRLTHAGELSFAELFEDRDRGQVIGLFLAMLELIRQKRVRFRQDHAFGTIMLALRAEDDTDAPPPAEAEPPEARATRHWRQPTPKEGRGLTWIQNEDDDDDADQGLRAIDRELKAINIPPDPQMLLRQPLAPPAGGEVGQSPTGNDPPAPPDVAEMPATTLPAGVDSKPADP